MAGDLADAPRLAGLVLSEAVRRARRRLAIGPLHRWRFSGTAPERLLVTPPDLRKGDSHIAADIYAGRFHLGGEVLETEGRSPFLLKAPSPAWQAELHAFGWLRHLSEADDPLARSNARALVSDWIRCAGPSLGARSHGVEVTSRRIVAWLSHAGTILGEADYPFYRRFMRSLARQLRYLRSVASEAPDGPPRLRARIALAYGSLCMPTPIKHMKNAARHLSDELDRQVFADGTVITRNPAAILDLLADLLPLRQTFVEQSQPVPRGLFTAIDRMLPALRFFRHADGALALFNGAGVTEAHLLAALLRHDETLGEPISQARQGGYQRLAAGGTVVLADTGLPPPSALSADAHAGTLSFELSTMAGRLVVNCGAPTRRDIEWRRLSRTTAAHSTLAVADQSSSRVTQPGLAERFIGSTLVAGPTRVAVSREDSDDGQRFIAAHDGYMKRFGLVHERQLFLSRDGRLVEGTDRLTSPGHRAGGRHPEPASIRFHLHPAVAAATVGDAVELVLKREVWRFEADTTVMLEDSIFFADSAGARRTLQIVLPFDPRHRDDVSWRFERLR
ncbi:heparinase II/III family protein [Aureimonas sp. Leaf454]|uniref:heparinase II/III family protein n=1 Tax=Aureimonas sp. Leaf454 TaxID=1736381 RepID=UPI00138F061A|nr:heparinase II/III family protein [Aureimonas sp. Leaf454]